jgi:hypothetical protein
MPSTRSTDEVTPESAASTVPALEGRRLVRLCLSPDRSKLARQPTAYFFGATMGITTPAGLPPTTMTIGSRLLFMRKRIAPDTIRFK